MTIARWNDAFLDGMRQVGDPQADAVIAAVLDSHGVERVNSVMRSLVRNDDLISEELPPEVRAYLKQSGQLPAWADREAIGRGEQFFDDSWPVIVMLLFCASLPSAYAAAKGAQVLHLTQRMTRHVHRRIFETAQFILDVMAPGGLSGSGHGIRSAQKVRLMHSATRHIIEHDPAWRRQWDESWGVPINQEDLAGTLMTFSLQIVLGMQRFGMLVTPEEAEAYLHAWKVVGHLIGVDESLMPSNMAEANILANTIFDRQEQASKAGTELTGALLSFMKSQLPGRWLDTFPATLVRQSIDADVADLLGVPRSNWTIALFKLELLFFRTLGRFNQRQHSRLLHWLSYQMVQELVTLERGGDRDLFRIPPTLQAAV